LVEQVSIPVIEQLPKVVGIESIAALGAGGSALHQNRIKAKPDHRGEE
jgi:hypothetical protein